ncbi:hypothetical protein MMC16_002202 [Acarospora aff. strigata]|nr:hypothetical protein [Acarospora aff. strigata]
MAVPVDASRTLLDLPFHFHEQMFDLPPISLKYFEDMLHKIDPDTCVFYYHLSAEARAWAKKRDPALSTVWGAFPAKAYEDTLSPLKDYYEAGRSVLYWELMCKAYTQACEGHSWVLIKPTDPDEPDHSIWTRVEYATIKKHESGIVEVERVDEKGENGRIIWKKPETGPASQGGKKKPPPSPIGGQPSMFQNGPPGSS